MSSTGTTRQKILPALALVPLATFFGAFVGGLVAGRLMEAPDNGWDGIAQALGGVMVGAVAGLVVAAVLVATLPPKRLWWSAGGAALALVALVLVAQWAFPRQDRQLAEPVPDRETTTPRPTTTAEPAKPVPPATEPPEPSATAPVEPPAPLGTLACDPVPGRTAARLAGSLAPGERYRETFGPGWELALDPLPGPPGTGWQIRVLEHGPPRFDQTELQPVEAAERDLAALTPPLRGPNPRFVRATDFLNAAGDAPNDGSRNAPQRLRWVIFSPDLDPGSDFGRGGLELVELDIEGTGEEARIEHLAFAACLTWPDGGELSPGALRISADDRAALRECGLPGSFRPTVRLEPPLRRTDLDDDGTADLAALVARRGDGALALAICRSGGRTSPSELDLIGPDEGLGELDPAYFRNVDWWSVDDSGGKAGLVLGKEGASSVRVEWTVTGDNSGGWRSVWLGD